MYMQIIVSMQQTVNGIRNDTIKQFWSYTNDQQTEIVTARKLSNSTITAYIVHCWNHDHASRINA